MSKRLMNQAGEMKLLSKLELFVLFILCPVVPAGAWYLIQTNFGTKYVNDAGAGLVFLGSFTVTWAILSLRFKTELFGRVYYITPYQAGDRTDIFCVKFVKRLVCVFTNKPLEDRAVITYRHGGYLHQLLGHGSGNIMSTRKWDMGWVIEGSRIISSSINLKKMLPSDYVGMLRLTIRDSLGNTIGWLSVDDALELVEKHPSLVSERHWSRLLESAVDTMATGLMAFNESNVSGLGKRIAMEVLQKIQPQKFPVECRKAWRDNAPTLLASVMETLKQKKEGHIKLN